MNTAIRKAVLYSVDKSPYDTPVYPYVWGWDEPQKRITVEMGRDDDGKRYLACLDFEHTEWRKPVPVGQNAQSIPGVMVHVSVWIIENPSIPDWSARDTMDTRMHTEAMNHFKGTLIGTSGNVYIPHVGL